MSYIVQTLKNDLTAILHNTTLNQITNVNGAINRAARQLLLDCDPQETKRITTLPTVYPNVYDYVCPSDLKGVGIVDIRPQVARLPWDVFSQRYNQDFDIWKNNQLGQGANCLADMVTVNFNTAIKTLRLNAPTLTQPPIILNNAENTTSNGTWSVSGTGSNLTNDYVNFVADGGSLQFDMTTGTANLTNSTMGQINLENHLNQSTLFYYVYLPTGAEFTSLTLKWGSDASNYYQQSATTDFQGNAFQNGWNMIGVAWLGATVVGTPDPSAIDYINVAYVSTANETAVRLNGIFSALGVILEIEYYSKFLFRDGTTGTFQETVTDDSNKINLDTESYNLMTNLTASLVVQQQQGMDAALYDGSFFAKQYQSDLQKYKLRYRSETQKPQTSFYRTPRINRGYLGGNWMY